MNITNNTLGCILLVVFGIVVISISVGHYGGATDPDVRYVYAEPDVVCVEPAAVYTKIWCMVSASFIIYDGDGDYLGADSFSNEVTAPYTEYDWTANVPIEDVVDAMGVQYNYVETINEKASYPADNKYVGSGSYVIHCGGGTIHMTHTATATRY